MPNPMFACCCTHSASGDTAMPRFGQLTAANWSGTLRAQHCPLNSTLPRMLSPLCCGFCTADHYRGSRLSGRGGALGNSPPCAMARAFAPELMPHNDANIPCTADHHYGGQLPGRGGARGGHSDIHRLLHCQPRHKQADAAGRQGERACTPRSLCSQPDAECRLLKRVANAAAASGAAAHVCCECQQLIWCGWKCPL